MCPRGRPAQTYGDSSSYADAREWTSKPEGQFYSKGTRVRLGGCIYEARWDTNKDPRGGLPTETGWYFFDELYDKTTSKPGTTAGAKVIGYIPTWRKEKDGNINLRLYANPELYRNITHGVVAFLTFDEDGSGAFSQASLGDLESPLPPGTGGRTLIDLIVTTAHQEEALISVALGGATDFAFLKFLTLVGEEMTTRREAATAPLDKLVSALLVFIDKHRLDGVDLDLEGWWGKGASDDRGGRPKGTADPAGYALTALAQKFHKHAPK